MMNQVQQTGTIYEAKTKTVTGIAMLSALAYILMFFEVPIP
ncbi:MAG: ECF transporter S component, partial [Lachnospiraceae bacterium]|nr:ECF transporter S component [Lachnospiraceae bacterium]